MAPILNHFTFMQIILCIYILPLLLCTASLLTRDHEECMALFQFKQTIFHENHPNTQKLDSWRQIVDNTSDNRRSCCLWDGVACNEKGHVIGLDLSQSFLNGSINSTSTLFNLVHLQKLNLSMNNFAKSRIPREIGRLTQLRSLDLSKSSFVGQIPIEISQLVRLSSLDLSWNSLDLENSSLENLVKNLTSLEELNLSGVNISSCVPLLLANFTSFKSIKLRNCQLLHELPFAILHLPNLKLLDVGVNPSLTGSLNEFRNNSLLEHLALFSTGFSGLIPASISNLNHLIVLDIGSCHFSGCIPGSLSNLTKLTHLTLGLNEFVGKVPSLASLSKLTLLDLSDNHFEKGRIHDWLSKLTSLDTLYLNRMNLDDEILPFMANLTTLRIVSMTGNSIFGYIPPSFMNLTQLSVIDLGANQLHGNIPSEFSSFKSLEYLALDHNNFSGVVKLDTFVELKKLETLYLSYNRISFLATDNYTKGTLPELKSLGLSSCNLKEFPSFLRFQKKMIGLFLYQNKIEGLVPEWIWNNSRETLHMIGLSNNFITGFHHNHPRFLPWLHLEVFEIEYNQLRGELVIPPQSTVVFDVSNNNLTGKISEWICKVESLRVLDLSSNNMTGTLPQCLGNLSISLLVLNLKGNRFHGHPTITFSQGSLLKRIDFSENQFTGRVFKSLANCTNLEFLSLGDNSFEDLFPFWLGSLPELQVLILRSNKFYGAIDHQGVLNINSNNFLKLRIIDLSNNNFIGKLPGKTFQTWHAMKSIYAGKSSVMGFELPFNTVLPFDFPYTMTLVNKGVKREYTKILNIFIAIDFSCNNFEGEIPHSLQELYGLEFLNLSNNLLTGRILPSLGNLKNLESLDLSRNQLSGEIPRQFLQLGFLSILNVSFNNLDGRIPQGEQFNTFDNSSYFGNVGLCGQPLSKECGNSKAKTEISVIKNNGLSDESESFLPSDGIDWVVVFLGIVSGLVTGIVFCKSRSARYSEWLVDRFGLKSARFVRSFNNRGNRLVL